jgi:hypothetical protein
MLIVKLFGGMGNQLFQYALGRHLALKSDLPLFVDAISGFQNDFYKRKYSLDNFNVKVREADTDLIHRFAHLQNPLGRKDKIHNLINRYILNFNPLFIREKHFHFDPEILAIKLRSITHLSGYWQSEKYFQEIESIIRQDFTFKTAISAKNTTLISEIQEKNTVCLHVRRLLGISDGQINEESVKHHGTADLTYYEKAIRLIAEREQNLHFYVFADSPEWAQAHLKLSFPTTFVSGNSDIEDLQLMSLCKHHIIANSSFSWWAAWLNANPDKIVCAPMTWVANKSVNTNDICPDSWIRI